MTRPETYKRPHPAPPREAACRKSFASPVECAVCGQCHQPTHDPLDRRGKYCALHCPICAGAASKAAERPDAERVALRKLQRRQLERKRRFTEQRELNRRLAV